jgi:hypothetical protein
MLAHETPHPLPPLPQRDRVAIVAPRGEGIHSDNDLRNYSLITCQTPPLPSPVTWPAALSLMKV